MGRRQFEVCIPVYFLIFIDLVFRYSPQKTALADLVPSATSMDIETALNNANGNIDAAAQDLLGTVYIIILQYSRYFSSIFAA